MKTVNASMSAAPPGDTPSESYREDNSCKPSSEKSSDKAFASPFTS